jgi:hypothetical protein
MFIYQEEGLPSQFYASPRGHQPTISSTSVQRDEIRNAQRARNTAEGQSAFGGSQSASISASTNFNRIVEGVEKLVESDTYEAPSGMPQLPEFLWPTQASTNIPYQTPMVPPGLGLQNAPAQSPTYPPFFTNSSIWGPTHPSLSHDVSPQRLDTAQALGPGSQLLRGAQEPYMSSVPSPSLVALQNELLMQQRQIEGRSSTPFGSTWTPPSISTPQPPLWDRSQFDNLPPYRTSLLQHSVQPPPGYDFPSSHNHAFIASTMSPPRASDNRQSTQDSSARFGAIGQQTPPCGQAG